MSSHWQPLLFSQRHHLTSVGFLFFLNEQCTQSAGEELVKTVFTLICDAEPWFVLRIVTVEKEAGLVGGAEQRLWSDWAAESINDGACLQRSTADL